MQKQVTTRYNNVEKIEIQQTIFQGCHIKTAICAGLSNRIYGAYSKVVLCVWFKVLKCCIRVFIHISLIFV